PARGSADLRRPGAGSRPQVHLGRLLRTYRREIARMSAEASVEITNERGLHARASAKFVKLAATFDAEVTVSKDGATVDARSIMGLMMLAAGPGSEIIIRAEGAEADAAVEALTELVTNRFEEDR